ncbi:penicillin-binding protein 2 [Alteriqipengyuania sp. WL0013]|uniref:penicillin-binding protein 2 n=1 Tax=Alteriqipengyuania sp. WL0013 TaxID=3110773 RepID=UPI002C65AD11|nr:penicillin-binding protein 2 [Alteriqipengyuania sp. WL0013]MEB3414998.1 penicillin-binding protein 2 [Alteriqipengyuania sp. WL0013]
MFRNPVRRVTSQTLGNTLERRTFLIGSIQAGIGTLLAGRMAYIAVAENERYAVLSESNRVNLSLIPPRRGWILDRNGAPLASNRADFRVDIIPERVKDAPATVAELGKLLDLDEVEQRDLLASIEEGAGFSPVEVKSSIDFDKFAAVSVRLPELPGVIPQRGFSRYYPTGPAVGHLLGYVGVANKEEFDEAGKDPLLVTPGYRIGKDGLEKQFEAPLRGEPGARRTEVTASGRIVRDLETREDVQGDAVKLAIDGPLQDYAARRLGLESGSVVVMDCESGDIVCMASMPSFDPNSFSQGIGSVEWKMLSEDDHVPLRNKVLKGLYPPGSTVKPMHCMAFLQAGIKPTETIVCGGGRRIGNRFFNCWSNHGVVDMAKAIYQSCDSYFYHFAQQIGFDPIAQMAETTGLGQEFDLPVTSQFYGTVPNPAWKEEKYGDPWRAYDTVNSSIGQGYYLANPLQLAVMSARLATGKMLMPRLVIGNKKPNPRNFNWDPEHIRVVREAMSDVVNGPGTAGRGRLPLENVQMAGKTGTAQVVSLRYSDGKTGPWKYRDHGLFVFFAPVENPRYAGAVVIEHGGGSSAAYPVARDVMTYLFDPQKALEQLYAFEEEWGGKPGERQLRKYRAYAEAAGVDVPRAPQDIAAFAARVDAEARARVVTAVEEDAQSTARPSRDGSPDPR